MCELNLNVCKCPYCKHISFTIYINNGIYYVRCTICRDTVGQVMLNSDLIELK